MHLSVDIHVVGTRLCAVLARCDEITCVRSVGVNSGVGLLYMKRSHKSDHRLRRY